MLQSSRIFAISPTVLMDHYLMPELLKISRIGNEVNYMKMKFV